MTRAASWGCTPLTRGTIVELVSILGCNRAVRWLPQSLLAISIALTPGFAFAQEQKPGQAPEKEQSATEKPSSEKPATEAPATEAPEARSVKTFFPNLLDEQKQIWTFPLHGDSWKKRGLWVAVGLSAASFSLDGCPAEKLRNDTSFHDFNEVFASSGSDIAVAALPLAITGLGELSGNEGLSEIGWKTSEAAADAYLVSTVWKLATQRSRPHEGKDYGFWEGGNSFPSGHAAVVWAVAATTAHHFRDHKWVAWLVYPAAAIVSFSRASSGNHFPSDVVVGSALGFAIGRYAVK